MKQDEPAPPLLPALLPRSFPQALSENTAQSRSVTMFSKGFSGIQQAIAFFPPPLLRPQEASFTVCLRNTAAALFRSTFGTWRKFLFTHCLNALLESVSQSHAGAGGMICPRISPAGFCAVCTFT